MTTAWLIERDGIHLCYAHDGFHCGRWVTFTDPCGWRFKTKAEAEAVIAERKLPATAVSHGWVDGKVVANASPPLRPASDDTNERNGDE